LQYFLPNVALSSFFENTADIWRCHPFKHTGYFAEYFNIFSKTATVQIIATDKFPVSMKPTAAIPVHYEVAAS